jgi:hypothetical protein
MVQFNIPSQLLDDDQRDESWIKNTVNAIIGVSNFGTNNEVNEYSKKLQDYYDGIIDENDYKHILKPLDVQYKGNVAGRLSKYNIIRPIIDTLAGEKSKRPFNDSVVILNSDANDLKEEAKKKQSFEYVYQMFLQELQAQGVNVDEQVEELPEYKEFMSTFDKTYRDVRAIRGQHAINYLKEEVSFKDKMDEAFKFFLITGRTVSVKRILNDNLDYEIIFPWNVDYDMSPKVTMIEDAEWGVIRHDVSFAELYRLIGNDVLADKGFEEGTAYLKDLENKYEYHHSFFNSDKQESSQNFIELFEVFWKTYKKVGILTYMDENNTPQTTTVPSNYKRKKGDIDLTWEYEEEVWTAFGLNKTDTEVFGAKPISVQRQLLSKKVGAKLSLNGRATSRHLAFPVSLVSLGVPFQILYDIYMYRLEQAINKAKDSMMLMDIDMLPDNMDINQFLYWIEKFGVGFIQYNKEGKKFSPQHQFEINIQSKLISLFIEALNFVLDSWERLSGVNAQRQGVINPYSGKGVTERAVIQSSNNTEEYFRMFDAFSVTELQSFLDWSKALWLDGMKGSYVLNSELQQFFEIDGMQHLETEYGIFVTNSSTEQENINMMKQFAQSMIKENGSVSAIGAIMKAESFAQVMDGLKEMERSIQEQQQAAAENEKQIEQMRQQTVDKQLQLQQNENEKERMLKLQLKEMDMMDKDDSQTTYKEKELLLKEKELQETIRSNKANETIDTKALNKKPTKP